MDFYNFQKRYWNKIEQLVEMYCTVKESTAMGVLPGSRVEVVKIPTTKPVGDTEMSFSTRESGWLGYDLGVTNRSADFRIFA